MELSPLGGGPVPGQLRGALRTPPETNRGRGPMMLTARHPTAPLQRLTWCPGHGRRLVTTCRMNREGQASRHGPCQPRSDHRAWELWKVPVGPGAHVPAGAFTIYPLKNSLSVS